MRRCPLFLAACLLLFTACGSRRTATPRAVSEGGVVAPVEAMSFFGRPLLRPALPVDFIRTQEKRLAEARARQEEAPGDVEALIWEGRRLAYLGHYRQAIARYGEAIAAHPNDPRLYRHRGHRYITIRLLELAIRDFERATALIAGHPDRVEPDGLPNARDMPTSTTHGNIWYHLGLAHYLRGDFAAALTAYRACLGVATNPDMQVATRHWLYMTLRRLGREAEAAAVLTPIEAEMDIIENHAYFRLLRLYQGAEEVETLLNEARRGSGLDFATTAYGIGNRYLYNGQAAEAEVLFREILASDSWSAFGFIAAEAEMARMARGAA